MTDDRDAELRALQEELNRPYIERPEQFETDLGGQCFLDRQRVCGADCTAFTDPQGPTAADRCQLLGSIAAGLELLTSLVKISKKPAPPPVVGPPLWKGGER